MKRLLAVLANAVWPRPSQIDPAEYLAAIHYWGDDDA